MDYFRQNFYGNLDQLPKQLPKSNRELTVMLDTHALETGSAQFEQSNFVVSIGSPLNVFDMIAKAEVLEPGFRHNIRVYPR